MHELSNRPWLLDASLKDANLVCDAALSKLVDSKSQIDHGRETCGGHVVAVRVHHQAHMRRRRRMQLAVIDQVRVDHGIESGPT
jgi:hypothetical protein